MHARARRRLSRGIKRKGMALLKKLRKANTERLSMSGLGHLTAVGPQVLPNSAEAPH